MVIINGFIRLVQTTGGGYDENGIPLPVTTSDGALIPVNLQQKSQSLNNTDANGNAYTLAEYTVILDNMTNVEGTESVKLFNRANSPLGVFSIESVEYLDFVNAIRLVVKKYVDNGQTESCEISEQ